MSTPSPKRAALAVFGPDSWSWVNDALARLQLDFARARDTALASTVIAASHGDRSRFLDLVAAASKDTFPCSLYRAWLSVEDRFDSEAGLDWFVQVIRDVAPLAIERGLHPSGSCYTLLIDHSREYRAETVAVVPLSSGMVHLCTNAERPDCEEGIPFVSPSEVMENIRPLLDSLPDAPSRT